MQAFFVAGGRIASLRAVPRHAGAALEVAAGVAAARKARSRSPVRDPEVTDELLLVASFLRRPPPELTVLPLDEARIVAAVRETGSKRAAV